ncbi:MAG: hypothetical protein COB96_04085 [Planctomycetota bacterium]|nr:MAG: hypothetical protein COB96_04085 [Planctomycetota bacterium]
MKNTVLAGFISFSFFAPMAFAQQALGPHPTRLVEPSAYSELGAGGAMEEGKAWHLLSPSFAVYNHPAYLAGNPEGFGELQGLLSMMSAEQGFDDQDSLFPAWAELVKPAPVQLTFRVQKKVDGSLLIAGSEQVRPGIPVSFQALTRSTIISDFDVEIAQGVAIADPISSLVFDGVSLGLRILPLPGSGWQVEVALCNSASLASSPIDSGSPDIAGLDHINRAIAEFANTVSLSPGSEVSMRIPGIDGAEYLLTMSIDGRVPPQFTSAPGPSNVVVVDSSAVVGDNFQDFVQALSGIESGAASQSGWLVFSGDSSAALAAEAAANVVAVGTSRRCRLEMKSTGDASKTLHVIEGYLTVGHPLLVAEGFSFQALTDWDVEVASSARIADPFMEECFSGLQARLELLEDGQVKLDLDITDCQLGEPLDITMGAPVRSSEDKHGGMLLDSQRAKVERLHTFQYGVHGTYQLDQSGKVLIRRSIDTKLDGMQDIVIELKVG